MGETDRREGARSGTVSTKYQIDGARANVIRNGARVQRPSANQAKVIDAEDKRKRPQIIPSPAG
jgi:hypothetical protein